MDYEWLRVQYIDERKSTTDIAKKVGVYRGTVLRWLKRFDIKIRKTKGLTYEQIFSKEKAMKIRRKLSEAHQDVPLTEKHRASIVSANKRKWKCAKFREKMRAIHLSPSYKKRQSIASVKKWENNEYRTKQLARYDLKCPSEAFLKSDRNLGRQHSKETIALMSKRAIERYANDEFRKRHLESVRSKENRQRISLRMKDRWRDKEYWMKHSGKNAPDWRGGKSFEPYSPEFNFRLKEKIRNRDERVCQLCDKSEILNGRRLDVHHIDSDKMNTKLSNLISLCRSCNSLRDTIEKEFVVMSINKYK